MVANNGIYYISDADLMLFLITKDGNKNDNFRRKCNVLWRITWRFSASFWSFISMKKVNRKVQEEPEAEVTEPWHQEEEKKKHRLTCV